MIISSKDGIRGVLFNKRSGTVIPKAIWFDTDTGDYEAFRLDSNQQDGIRRDEKGTPIRYRGRTELKFIQGETLRTKEESPISVSGNGAKRFSSGERLPVPIFSCKCQHSNCNRIAEWLVSDEIEIEPEVVNGRKYSRAKTVGMRYYCSWHYQGPRILDEKGEIIEQIEEITARPQ